MEHSITKKVNKYISEKPSVKDCLHLKLINYSSLSRAICDELEIDNFDAVLVACRRYFARGRSRNSRQEQIMSLVQKSKLISRNKIIAAIIVKNAGSIEKIHQLQREVIEEDDELNVIFGDAVVTVITSENHTTKIRNYFKDNLKRLSEELAQISLIFDKRIETTSGVVAYIYGILAENNINILEEMSCWTELMIIVHEEDLGKTLQLLS